MTIVCLCLSVSMLTFGVYAATSVSFSISSSVSFKVTRLFIDIDAGVTGGNIEGEKTFDFNCLLAQGNPNETPLEWKESTTNGDGVTVNGSIKSLNFLPTPTGKKLTFTFKFTNRGAKPVTATIETTYPSAKVTQSIAYSTGTSVSILPTQNQTVTVDYTLKSFGHSIDPQSLIIQFNFTD